MLKDPFDLDEVLRRARHLDRASMDVAELLLDQRVAAGIGNIFKCESLFALKVAPHSKVDALDDDTVGALYAEASAVMRASVMHGRLPGRIYQSRVCPSCRGRVSVEEQADRLTWCRSSSREQTARPPCRSGRSRASSTAKVSRW